MKIYEGTDGLRGLITKLIEVWDFKKIVYEIVHLENVCAALV